MPSYFSLSDTSPVPDAYAALMNPTILRRLPIYATGVGFALGLTAIAISREWSDLLTLGVGLGVATFYTVFVLVPHLIREQEPGSRSHGAGEHGRARRAPVGASSATSPVPPRRDSRFHRLPSPHSGREVFINRGRDELSFPVPVSNEFSLGEDATPLCDFRINAEFHAVGAVVAQEGSNDEDEAFSFASVG